MDTSQASTRLQMGEEAENATAMAFSANRCEPARIIAYPGVKSTKKTSKQTLADRLEDIRWISARLYDALDAMDIGRSYRIAQGIRYLAIEAQQLLEKEAAS